MYLRIVRKNNNIYNYGSMAWPYRAQILDLDYIIIL